MSQLTYQPNPAVTSTRNYITVNIIPPRSPVTFSASLIIIIITNYYSVDSVTEAGTPPVQSSTVSKMLLVRPGP